MDINKLNPSTVGFLQALGLILYCALIGKVLWSFGKILTSFPEFLGIVLMLLLLVFSAAITGSIVFGYAAYLAINKKTKRALSVFTYTLFYSLGIILAMTLVIAALSLS